MSPFFLSRRKKLSSQPPPTDPEYVDWLIKLIDNSIDDAALDHNRRAAAGELAKITDLDERARLEKKIRESGAPLN